MNWEEYKEITENRIRKKQKLVRRKIKWENLGSS